MPSVRNITIAISASVTPRSFLTGLTSLACLIAAPRRPGGGQLCRLGHQLLDQDQSLDQRPWWAARRAAAPHESQEPAGHRLLTAAVPRARALVDEYLRQIIQLYRVAARASTVLSWVVQPYNDDAGAAVQPVRAGVGPGHGVRCVIPGGVPVAPDERVPGIVHRPGVGAVQGVVVLVQLRRLTLVARNPSG